MSKAGLIELAARPRRFKPYPAYKDTGVEWLRKIPAHWEVKRLKYLSRIIMGQSPPSDIVNTFGEGLPFLQGNADFGTEHPTARTFCPYPPKVAVPGDILISVRAPVGAINRADRAYGIGRGLCAIRPIIRQLERRYCSYLLQIARSQLDSIATGSTYDAVSADDVSCFLMLMPLIEEQQIIVSALDRETAKTDALVEKKERLIELLQEKRTALITQAVTKGLDPNVPMKDSGVEWLGKIPAHWERSRIKFLARIASGYAPPDGFDPTSGEYPIYGSNGLIGYCDRFFVTEITIAVGRVGASGSVNFVPPKSWVTDNALLLRQPRPHINLMWLYNLLRTMNLGEQASKNAQPIITGTFLGNQLLGLPPEQEQRIIASFLDRETAKIDALVAKIHEAIDRLKEYRSALISAVVTGKVDVRELA